MSDQPANLIDFKGTLNELYAAIKSHPGLSVVKYGSTTCMPCKRVRQLLPGMARDNEDVKFYNVEIDQQPEIKEALGISSVPYTVFYKGVGEDGNPAALGNVMGAQIPQIKGKIAELK